MCQLSETEHPTMVSYANALGARPALSSQLPGLHQSLLTGSSAAPSHSLSHKHVWAICVLKTGEDISALPLPHEFSWHSLVKYTEEQIAVHLRGNCTSRKAVWCTHLTHTHLRSSETGCQSQEASVSFCFASVRRVNVAFVRAHRGVSHQSPLQN